MNPDFLDASGGAPQAESAESKRERIARELAEIEAGEQECLAWFAEHADDETPEANETRSRYQVSMMELEKRKEKLLIAQENIL